MNKHLTRALLTCMALSLSACGWQLRGVDSKSETSSASTLEEQSKTPASTKSGNAASQESTKAPTVSSSTIEERGIRLVMQHRNHGLAAALKRVAWENKLDLSDSGQTWLIVEDEKLEKRPLTVTETGVAAQYQLILTISFSQKNADGKIIVPRQQIVSWRSYDFDAKLIVAKAQEEEALIVEMREELARRILALLQK